MSICVYGSQTVSLIILLEAIYSSGITGSKGRKIFKSHDASLSIASQKCCRFKLHHPPSYPRRNPIVSNTEGLIIFCLILNNT